MLSTGQIDFDDFEERRRRLERLQQLPEIEPSYVEQLSTGIPNFIDETIRPAVQSVRDSAAMEFVRRFNPAQFLTPTEEEQQDLIQPSVEAFKRLGSAAKPDLEEAAQAMGPSVGAVGKFGESLEVPFRPFYEGRHVLLGPEQRQFEALNRGESGLLGAGRGLVEGMERWGAETAGAIVDTLNPERVIKGNEVTRVEGKTIGERAAESIMRQLPFEPEGLRGGAGVAEAVGEDPEGPLATFLDVFGNPTNVAALKTVTGIPAARSLLRTGLTVKKGVRAGQALRSVGIVRRGGNPMDFYETIRQAGPTKIEGTAQLFRDGDITYQEMQMLNKVLPDGELPKLADVAELPGAFRAKEAQEFAYRSLPTEAKSVDGSVSGELKDLIDRRSAVAVFQQPLDGTLAAEMEATGFKLRTMHKSKLYGKRGVTVVYNPRVVEARARSLDIFRGMIDFKKGGLSKESAYNVARQAITVALKGGTEGILPLLRDGPQAVVGLRPFGLELKIGGKSLPEKVARYAIPGESTAKTEELFDLGRRLQDPGEVGLAARTSLGLKSIPEGEITVAHEAAKVSKELMDISPNTWQRLIKSLRELKVPESEAQLAIHQLARGDVDKAVATASKERLSYTVDAETSRKLSTLKHEVMEKLHGMGVEKGARTVDIVDNIADGKIEKATTRVLKVAKRSRIKAGDRAVETAKGVLDDAERTLAETAQGVQERLVALGVPEARAARVTRLATKGSVEELARYQSLAERTGVVGEFKARPRLGVDVAAKRAARDLKRKVKAAKKRLEREEAKLYASRERRKGFFGPRAPGKRKARRVKGKFVAHGKKLQRKPYVRDDQIGDVDLGQAGRDLFGEGRAAPRTPDKWREQLDLAEASANKKIFAAARPATEGQGIRDAVQSLVDASHETRSAMRLALKASGVSPSAADDVFRRLTLGSKKFAQSALEREVRLSHKRLTDATRLSRAEVRGLVEETAASHGKLIKGFEEGVRGTYRQVLRPKLLQEQTTRVREILDDVHARLTSPVVRTADEAKVLSKTGVNPAEQARAFSQTPGEGVAPSVGQLTKTGIGDAASMPELMAAAGKGRPPPPGPTENALSVSNLASNEMAVVNPSYIAKEAANRPVVGTMYQWFMESPTKGFVGRLGAIGKETAFMVQREAGIRRSLLEEWLTRYGKMRGILKSKQERIYAARARELKFDEIPDKEWVANYLNGKNEAATRFVDEMKALTDDIADVLGLPKGERNSFYVPRVLNRKFAQQAAIEQMEALKKAYKDGTPVELPNKGLVTLANKAELKVEMKRVAEKLDLYSGERDVANIMPRHALRRIGADFAPGDSYGTRMGKKRLGPEIENDYMTQFLDDPDEIFPRYVAAASRANYLEKVVPGLKHLRSRVVGNTAGDAAVRDHLDTIKELVINPNGRMEDKLIRGIFRNQIFSPKMMAYDPRIIDKSMRWVRRLAFQKFLGLNPASMMVNFTQGPLNIIPVLGARYYGRAIADTAAKGAKRLALKDMDDVRMWLREGGRGGGRGKHYGTQLDLAPSELEIIDDVVKEVTKLGKAKQGIFDIGALMFQFAENTNIITTARAAHLKMKDMLVAYKGVRNEGMRQGLTGRALDRFAWGKMPGRFKDGLLFSSTDDVIRQGADTQGHLLREGSKLGQDAEMALMKVRQKNVSLEHLGEEVLDPMAKLRTAVERGVVGERQFMKNGVLDAVNHLQFSYIRENLPIAAHRSSIARAALQFTDFQRQQMELIFQGMGPLVNKAGKINGRALKAHGKFWFMMAALGGPYAAPFFGDLARHSEGVRNFGRAMTDWIRTGLGGKRLSEGGIPLTAEELTGLNFGMRFSLGVAYLPSSSSEGAGGVAETIAPGLGALYKTATVPFSVFKASPEKLLEGIPEARRPEAIQNMLSTTTGTLAGSRAVVSTNEPILKSGPSAAWGKAMGVIADLPYGPTDLPMPEAMRQAMKVERLGPDRVSMPGPKLLEALPVASTYLSRLTQASQMREGMVPDKKGRPSIVVPPGLRGDVMRWGMGLGLPSGGPMGPVVDRIEKAEEEITMMQSGAKSRLTHLVEQGVLTANEAAVEAARTTNTKIPAGDFIREIKERRNDLLTNTLKGLSGDKVSAIRLQTDDEFIHLMTQNALAAKEAGNETGALGITSTLKDTVRKGWISAIEGVYALGSELSSEEQETRLIGIVGDVYRQSKKFNDPKWRDEIIGTNIVEEDFKNVVRAKTGRPLEGPLLSESGYRNALGQYVLSKDLGLLSVRIKQLKDDPDAGYKAIEHWIQWGTQKTKKKKRYMWSPRRYTAALFLESRGIDPSPLLAGSLVVQAEQ
jgi:hypothetical protein